jgi:hypothetical protein
LLLVFVQTPGMCKIDQLGQPQVIRAEAVPLLPYLALLGLPECQFIFLDRSK